jgi:hypothetical protein
MIRRDDERLAVTASPGSGDMCNRHPAAHDTPCFIFLLCHLVSGYDPLSAECPTVQVGIHIARKQAPMRATRSAVTFNNTLVVAGKSGAIKGDGNDTIGAEADGPKKLDPLDGGIGTDSAWWDFGVATMSNLEGRL